MPTLYMIFGQIELSHPRAGISPVAGGVSHGKQHVDIRGVPAQPGRPKTSSKNGDPTIQYGDFMGFNADTLQQTTESELYPLMPLVIKHGLLEKLSLDSMLFASQPGIIDYLRYSYSTTRKGNM